MKRTTLKIAAVCICAALLAVLPGLVSAEPKNEISEQEAYEIGMEAYIYLYPLVVMDMTRRHNINFKPGQKQGLGPMNMFHHMKTYQTVEDRDVVRPNFDTLYSRAWVDLTDGPVIVSVPDTDGRYQSQELCDCTPRLAGNFAKSSRANRCADTIRVDYRPYRDQRSQGLQKCAQSAGRLCHDTTVAIGQKVETSQGQARSGV